MKSQAMQTVKESELPQQPQVPIDVRDPWWQEISEGAALRAVAAAGVVGRHLFGRLAGQAPGIITYHRISPVISGLPAPLHNVPPRRFRRQLSGLLRRGFVPWPLERLLEVRDDPAAVPERVFAVTFDDGFETVYSQAWPVLRELKIPATLFISTAFIGKREPFACDAWGIRFAGKAPAESYRPLNWDQCREMVESGIIALGAHTHTHRDLRGQAVEFAADVQRSVEVLREHFDCRPIPFAFPFGSPRRGHAGPELVAAARTTDVTCGLTTEPITVDLAGDPFTWGRFNAFAWDTATTLAAKLDGWYGWAPKLKRRVEALVNNLYANGTR